MAQAKCVFAFVVAVEQGYRCREHTHPCTEIVLSRDGDGTLVQSAHQYQYGDGAVLVYQPGQRHWIEQRAAGWHVCLGVVGCDVQSVPPGVYTGAPTVRQWFDQARAALEKPGAFQKARLDFLAGLIALELRELTTSQTAQPPSHAQRAREIIEQSFHEPLSVSVLAEKIYISPDYLRQVFRREFGESLMHYLIRKRIEFAAELLRSTTDPVKVIAAQSGYDNPYHFSRMFKKLMGQSPVDYRRKMV